MAHLYPTYTSSLDSLVFDNTNEPQSTNGVDMEASLDLWVPMHSFN
jgi:hypothetical protein